MEHDHKYFTLRHNNYPADSRYILDGGIFSNKVNKLKADSRMNSPMAYIQSVSRRDEK